MEDDRDYRTLMTDLQYCAVRRWLHNNGSANVRPAADALKLLEEVLELCYCSGALIAEVDKVVAVEAHKALQRGEASGKYDHDKASEEVGDVLLCIAAVCSKQDINGVSSVAAVLKKVSARKLAPDYDGILRREERLVDGMRLEDNKAYMKTLHQNESA